MKLIIAGSRELAISTGELNRLISIAGFKPTEIVSGACRGIDRCGEIWAEEHQLRVTRFPYRSELGKAGGPARNAEMADYADALLAFPGIGKGTWSMIRLMKEAGKPAKAFDLAKGLWL